MAPCIFHGLLGSVCSRPDPNTFYTSRCSCSCPRLFHLGCVGWMKNLLSGVVNFFFFFFFASYHQVSFFWWGVVSVKSRHLTGWLFSPPLYFLSHSFFWFCVELFRKLQVKHLSDLEKTVFIFVEDEWLTQLGEYGNEVLMLTQRASRVETNLFMKRF